MIVYKNNRVKATDESISTKSKIYMFIGAFAIVFGGLYFEVIIYLLFY